MLPRIGIHCVLMCTKASTCVPACWSGNGIAKHCMPSKCASKQIGDTMFAPNTYYT